MRALLLILFSATLIGMLLAQRRGRSGLGIPAVLVALLALGTALTFTLRPQSPTYVHRLEPFHRAVGYRLGQCIREKFPEAAAIIVLQDRRERDSLQRYAARQIEGLQEGLGGTGTELAYVNMREMTSESTRPAEEGIERATVQSSFDRFKALVDVHPESLIIVSFVGYPVYLRLLLRRDPRYRAFVWDVGAEESVKWDAELSAQRVCARVRFKPQPNLKAEVTGSTPLEEIFAMRYELDSSP